MDHAPHAQPASAPEAPIIQEAADNAPKSAEGFTKEQVEAMNAHIKNELERLGISKAVAAPAAADHAKPAEDHAGHAKPAEDHAHDHAKPHALETKVTKSSDGTITRITNAVKGNVTKEKLLWNDRFREDAKTVWRTATWPVRAGVWTGRKIASGGLNVLTLGQATKLYEKRESLGKWLKGGEETAKAPTLWEKAKAYLREPKRAIGTGILVLNPWVAVPAAAILTLGLTVGAIRDTIRTDKPFPGISEKEDSGKTKAKTTEG